MKISSKEAETFSRRKKIHQNPFSFSKKVSVFVLKNTFLQTFFLNPFSPPTYQSWKKADKSPHFKDFFFSLGKIRPF